MKYLLIFCCLLPLTTAAQDVFDLPHEEIYPEPQDVLVKKREKYLRNESMIYDLNTDYGIRDQRRYTGSDHNRISIAGHINGSYEHVSDLLGIEFNYMRRSERYHQGWWGIQAFTHRTFFHNLSVNPSSGHEAQFQRPRHVKNGIWGAGPGLGYRFKFLQDLLNTDEIFETVDVFANYLELSETFIGMKYQGWGLSANYGVHKRVNTNFFWGGKFSYNLGVVTRDAIETEVRNQRSLSLGWMSYALELGMFF
jgi:hypothetical protein